MRFMIPLLCTLALLATAACETIEGAGRDMTAAGQSVTAEAQQAGY